MNLEGGIISPVLQVEKLRLREVKGLSQCCTGVQLNSDSQIPILPLYNITLIIVSSSKLLNVSKQVSSTVKWIH